MGLDSVELLIEVENAFDIKIPDQEAEKIITVGDFYEVVWLHLAGRYSNRCNSQILFYRLRGEMVKQLDISRGLVLLTSPLVQLLDGKEDYELIQQKLGLQFPVLRLPEPLSTIWIWGATGLILGSLSVEVLLISMFSYPASILLWTVVAIGLVILVDRLLKPFRVDIPNLTVREFTNSVLALNFNDLSKKVGVNRREMELVMNEIIVNKLGVDPIEVAPDKSLTDDLGLS